MQLYTMATQIVPAGCVIWQTGRGKEGASGEGLGKGMWS